MKIRTRLTDLALLPGLLVILAAGCRSSQPAKPAGKIPGEISDSAAFPVASEIQNLAEKALGPGAEIVAHGDLARNGLEELLVITRFKKLAGAGSGSGERAGLFINQAAIVEKSGQRWTEVLRCDERLKNSRGYLGGAQSVSVTGWLLRFTPDTQQGLRMDFTPADAAKLRESAARPNKNSARTVTVQWNASAKLYQALDRSNNRYLSEVPALETPQSIIR